MSRTTSLAALLERRLGAFRQHLPAALEGDLTGVHQARVASRRLRETLPVLASLTRERAVDKVREDVRHVTRVLGPVRELDVALGHLADHVTAHHDLAAQGAVVRKWLERTRSSRRDEMRDALDEETLDRLWRRVDALPGLVTDDALARPEWRAALARRIRGRADELARQTEATGVLYDPHALHLVRIATKKLRYAVELAGELRLGPTAAALRALKRQQELLGDIHDREVLMGFADRAIAEIPARAGVARLVGDWQRECRELHARYLRTRAAVVRVAEYAAGELARRVAGPRVRVARRS
jgi:CHAD domain-containing protein